MTICLAKNIKNLSTFLETTRLEVALLAKTFLKHIKFVGNSIYQSNINQLELEKVIYAFIINVARLGFLLQFWIELDIFILFSKQNNKIKLQVDWNHPMTSSELVLNSICQINIQISLDQASPPMWIEQEIFLRKQNNRIKLQVDWNT